MYRSQTPTAAAAAATAADGFARAGAPLRLIRHASEGVPRAAVAPVLRATDRARRLGPPRPAALFAVAKLARACRVRPAAACRPPSGGKEGRALRAHAPAKAQADAAALVRRRATVGVARALRPARAAAAGRHQANARVDTLRCDVLRAVGEGRAGGGGAVLLHGEPAGAGQAGGDVRAAAHRPASSRRRASGGCGDDRGGSEDAAPRLHGHQLCSEALANQGVHAFLGARPRRDRRSLWSAPLLCEQSPLTGMPTRTLWGLPVAAAVPRCGRCALKKRSARAANA